jgi:hypothetical protein
MEQRLVSGRRLYRVTCACGYKTVWAWQPEHALQMYRKHLPRRDNAMLGAKEGMR